MTDTTTLLIPFKQNVLKPETGYDTMIALVPPDQVGNESALFMKLAQLSVEQAAKMNEGIRTATWWITSDPEIVKERGGGDRCPTCLAGVDQALAHLKNHPDAVMGVGLLSWCDSD